MPTKHSLATYYHETPAIAELMDQFGNHFEALTAVEKFTLIGILSLWQGFDTESHLSNKGGMTLPQALKDTAIEIFHGEATPNVCEFLNFLIRYNADDCDAMPLMSALINQISEGVYQS
ncbi:hypothetical protein [Leptolyngbya sp. NIES-2104]|uniref:hypothetical protein n=1 Tax=Leptolyngbya sp. NIES-2104 TaxID=1552121 RepID=UPI0006ECB38D|nr:hypothetical protein [Leptolyngbya sp. NIES-2104]GAP99095.1 hypothetical protein NIES2104_56520 [Leptolyngbya sp. NIES-2104]